MSTCSSAHKARLGPKTRCTFSVRGNHCKKWLVHKSIHFRVFLPFWFVPGRLMKKWQDNTGKAIYLVTNLHAVFMLVCFYMLILFKRRKKRVWRIGNRPHFYTKHGREAHSLWDHAATNFIPLPLPLSLHELMSTYAWLFMSTCSSAHKGRLNPNYYV
jgi:hypothetical protein